MLAVCRTIKTPRRKMRAVELSQAELKSPYAG